MPKSKRNKMVSLTKVKRKGRDGKEDLLGKVQQALDNYEHSYVLSFENMRSAPFKQMQNEMHGTTKFFHGKNKVIAKALGKTPEDEIKDNTGRLSQYLTGQVCLAFSSLKMADFD